MLPPIPPSLIPFCDVTEKDAEFGAPIVQLLLYPSNTIYSNKPEVLKYTLHIESNNSERGDRETAMIHWNTTEVCPRSTLRLLHHHGSDLQAVDVPAVDTKNGVVENVFIDDSWPSNHILCLSGGCTWSEDIRLSLTANYVAAMTPGETYTILFPGKKIDIWDWGWDLGRTLSRRSAEPCMIIPGGAHITFTFKDEALSWPTLKNSFATSGTRHARFLEQIRKEDNSIIPPPYTEFDRALNAPLISVTLSCEPPELKRDRGQYVCLVRTLVYEAPPSARPIVIHKPSVLRQSPFRERDILSKSTSTGWEYVQPPNTGSCGFYLWEDDPSLLNVGKDRRNFLCLRPGESYEKAVCIYEGKHTGHGRFPEHMQIGDSFQITYMGTEIQWWDYGSMEEHEKTAVWAKNSDAISGNDMRPRLIIPGADVEIEVVE